MKFKYRLYKCEVPIELRKTGVRWNVRTEGADSPGHKAFQKCILKHITVERKAILVEGVVHL